MVKKIDVTQVGFSISRLIRLGFINYLTIIFYTALGFLFAFVYTSSPFINQKTYISSGSISHISGGNAATINTIVNAVTSIEFSENISLQLEEEGIGSINGSFLSAETIKNSLTVLPLPNSSRINISFSFPEETLSVTILNKIIDQSIIFTNTNYPVLNNGVILGDYALLSKLYFNGVPFNIYLLYGSLIGFTIGGFIGVLLHALKGTIYSIKDIRDFEISSFYLQMKLINGLNFDRFLNLLGFGRKINFELEQTKLIQQGLVGSSSFTTIQNNLESIRNKPEEPLTTLMITPTPNSSLSMVGFAYARQSSTQGRKTIIVDFDLKNVPFTKYLETYKIETKKKASSKEGVNFLSLEENLDLYLPLQDIIPAKVIRDENTQDIIALIKKKYDHIIIFGPSLLSDSSFISILNYVNSVLIVVKSSKSTLMELIKSVNLLIDNQLTAIETLVVEEKIKAKFRSFNEIKSWLTFNSNLKKKPTTKLSKKK